MNSLGELVRWSMTVFGAVLVAAAVAAFRSPLRGWLLAWAVPSGVVAFGLTHVADSAAAFRLLPLGVGMGVMVAIVSLFSSRARSGFDALTDDQLRHLTSFRGIYGALLLAAAALDLVPQRFGLEAGLGDLLTAALVSASPTSLVRGGRRSVRLLVHAVGLIDFVNVFALMITLVRPWLDSTRGPGPSLVLPWVVVPLLLSVNLHGLRQVFQEPRPESAKSGHDGPEPSGGVRSAVG
jgi:hypothetical protein